MKLELISIRARVWLGCCLGAVVGLLAGTSVLLVEREVSTLPAAKEQAGFVAEVMIDLITSGQLTLPVKSGSVEVSLFDHQSNPDSGDTPVYALGDGRRVQVSILPDSFTLRPPPFPWRALALAALVAASSGALLAHTVNRALRDIERAVERLDLDHDGQPMPETTGPFEQRLVMKAFNRMQLRIREQIKGRLYMAAAISHDLKTPLAKVLFRIEGIEELELRDAIERDVLSMLAMINSTISYVNAVGQNESKERVDIKALLDAISDDLRWLGPVRIHLDELSIEQPSRGLIVLSSHMALVRAFTNVIDNGLRYGRKVDITAEANLRTVEVEVNDSGPRFGVEELDRAGQPFFRGATVRASGQPGHGLGLAIAKGLIESQGGALLLNNRPGGGARVTIRLPRAADRLPHSALSS